MFLKSHPLRAAPRLNELYFIRNVSQWVSQRATTYLATVLHALWALRTAEEGLKPGKDSQIAIACHGNHYREIPPVPRQYAAKA